MVASSTYWKDTVASVSHCVALLSHVNFLVVGSTNGKSGEDHDEFHSSLHLFMLIHRLPSASFAALYIPTAHCNKSNFALATLLQYHSIMSQEEPPFSPSKCANNHEPFLTARINRHLPPDHPVWQRSKDMADNPSFRAVGLSPVSEGDSPARRERKLSLLNTLSRFQPQNRQSKANRADGSTVTSPVDQPPAGTIDSQIERSYLLGHAWTFWHDKHAPSGDYEGRLTPLQDDIMDVKLFWEVVNSFPLQRLGFKDSVHFFKRGVKPVWEDPRNVNGGAWTFRVPKEKTDQFWKELLVLAVGEEFFDVVQKGKILVSMPLQLQKP